MLNRPAPPHFRGLDSSGEFSSYHRHLPHWRQPGATYFVTFRLADSIPADVLGYMRRLRAEIDARRGDPASSSLFEEYERKITQRMEDCLDEAHGACLLRDDVNRQIVRERIAHGEGRHYFVACGVIMPNHCHLLIQLLNESSLESILGQIKAYSAMRINSRVGRNGTLWQEESYDRIVRDEEHLYRVVQYIGRNPLKIRLNPPDQWRWIHPEWIAAGWAFDATD